MKDKYDELIEAIEKAVKENDVQKFNELNELSKQMYEESQKFAREINELYNFVFDDDEENTEEEINKEP